MFPLREKKMTRKIDVAVISDGGQAGDTEKRVNFPTDSLTTDNRFWRVKYQIYVDAAKHDEQTFRLIP